MLVSFWRDEGRFKACAKASQTLEGFHSLQKSLVTSLVCVAWMCTLLLAQINQSSTRSFPLAIIPYQEFKVCHIIFPAYSFSQRGSRMVQSWQKFPAMVVLDLPNGRISGVVRLNVITMLKTIKIQAYWTPYLKSNWPAYSNTARKRGIHTKTMCTDNAIKLAEGYKYQYTNGILPRLIPGSSPPPPLYQCNVHNYVYMTRLYRRILFSMEMRLYTLL